jgi:penicillin-binding protein 2
LIRDFRKNKRFNRRRAIVGSAQIGLMSLLVSRLGYLQIFKNEEYSTKSDNNRIKPLISPAPRGIIYDRNGEELTGNRSNYRLLFYSEKRSKIPHLVEVLSEILDLTAPQKENIVSKIRNSRGRKVVSLIDNMSWNDVARVESNYHKLSGVAIQSGILRFYPHPFETSHLVGYASLPSESDSNNQNKNLFLHPDFRIGKGGIEKKFDELLRGKFGVKYVEVNASGTPVRTISKQESVEGGEIDLTIDLNLQKFITERVKDLSASVIVMNSKTGEILAAVSSPSFDPNKFVEGISPNYWKKLIGDKRKPLNNKTITAAYPPGSTFKLMVAIAALENGINPKDKVNCTGKYRLGRRVFHCWKKEGHGMVDMSGAIKHSCNSYFFDISREVGIDKISETASKFGYGQNFDINLFGGRSGLLPSKEWKKRVYKERWVGGDTLNSSIGQGFVLASPLQMAVAVSRVVNKGVPIEPYLIKNSIKHDQYQKLKDDPIVDEKHIDLIIEGMNRVVNEEKGTAYYRRIAKKNLEMIGKTGTSQVVSKREEEMSDEQIERHKNHAIFVGAAPRSSLKYAISVVVEHGGSGSSAAAPIGRDVLRKAQELNI